MNNILDMVFSVKQVFIGGDHRGYGLKKILKVYLEEKGVKVVDLGVFDGDVTDYPDIAREVGEKIQENKEAAGILICGSGVGVSIAANKLRGVRAALVHTVELAKKSREHDWANVVCMGAEVVSEDVAKGIVDAFLGTEFLDGEDGRYKRRAQKVDLL